MKNQPIFLDQQNSLFCVVTEPAALSAKRETGVVILNSGTIHNVGPFNLSVDLANSLSNCGFTVLRLDQTGKGESSYARREADEFETLKRDIQLAYSALANRYGINKVALVGLCSGADHGMEIASIVDQTTALVMFDGWAPRNTRYYLAKYAPKLRQPLRVPALLAKRLFPKHKKNPYDEMALQDVAEGSQRRWDQSQKWKQIAAICSKQLPVYAIYTGDTDDYYCYEGQLCNALTRKGIDSTRIIESYRRNHKHLYPLSPHRKKLVEDVTQWLSSTV